MYEHVSLEIVTFEFIMKEKKFFYGLLKPLEICLTNVLE